MGKITKIMLGLNIVAGVAGIVFGMGVKGDLKEAEAAKIEAVASAEDAKKGTSGLETANKQHQADLQKAGTDYASLSNNLGAATMQLKTANEAKETAEKLQQEAEADAAKNLSELEEYKGMSRENIDLKTEIADYKALGTVEELLQWKKKAESKPKPGGSNGNGSGGGPKPPKPKPNAGAQVGAIASYDPKFNFYVINRGADHGIKAGDEFNVLRAGNLVGKLKIKQTQPTVSIADAIKAFTRQQLQPGDKVVKSN